MRRCIRAGLLFAVVAAGLWAQEEKDLLGTFQRNFEMAGLEVKVQVLADAAERPEGMGPLFLQALDFVINNADQLSTEMHYRRLAVIAADGIRRLNYGEARTSLWRLFLEEADSQVRMSILNTLGGVAAGDAATVRRMIEWLESQNSLHAAGRKPDLQVILAGVRAFGQIKDPTAFAAVFTTLNLGISEEITRSALASLQAMEGDLAGHLGGVIRARPPVEKLHALRLALGSDRLENERKGEVAELALETALGTNPTSTRERGIVRDLRREAARALSERRWTRATPLAIESFNQTLQEFDRGIADRQALIEAVQCLGNMGSHEAAVRLTKYLVLLNAYMESGQGTDEQIMLSILENLGRLGDKVAYADLQYTQYLGYSSRIKNAARQSLDSLKW